MSARLLAVRWGSVFMLLAVVCGGCPLLPSPEIDSSQPEGNETTQAVSNSAPAANAGDDLSARPGELVLLDATGTSDADADRLMFTWVQSAGEPQVELSGQFSAVASFQVPDDLSAASTLTFQVTVIDGKVAVSDEVSVTITP